MNDVVRQMTGASQWLDRFRERNGRAPTVLHIGNIANAAYLNARMLNEAGIDCDVLCYEYYHIMGCPEWESAVFDVRGVNPDRPLWSEIDLHGFERPRWFAQGALGTCIDYLVARRTGHETADKLWRQLQREQADPRLEGTWDNGPATSNDYAGDIEARISELVTAFRIDFPLRRDRLSTDALRGTLAFSGLYFGQLRRLCSLYDVVIGYSTDGILPLSVGKRPYLAYEHGTIRALPFEDNTDGRLWPGQFLNVVLTLDTQTATLIPSEAVQVGQQGSFVYAVKADQSVEPRPVTVGQTTSGKVVIEKGIVAGETIVTDGQSRLFPGAKISTK